jgi:hypothetical protein
VQSCSRGPSPAVRGGQPARRRLRQRPPPAQLRPPPDRRAVPSGHPPLRHLPAAARLPRLRVQDPGQVPRDRLHPPRRHRRLQAARHHPQSGGLHQGPEAEGPRNLRLGDPRQAPLGRHLRQVQRALGQLHQQDPAEQDRLAGAPGAPLALALQRHLPQLPLSPAEAADATPAATRHRALLAQFAFGVGYFGGSARGGLQGASRGARGSPGTDAALGQCAELQLLHVSAKWKYRGGHAHGQSGDQCAPLDGARDAPLRPARLEMLDCAVEGDILFEWPRKRRTFQIV